MAQWTVRDARFDLGSDEDACRETLDVLHEHCLMERIWRRDHRVWKPSPAEISDRLGWLDCPLRMMSQIPEIGTFTDALRRDGFTHALLLGMGGSSLAAEVYRYVFGVRPGFLDLRVLDSTDPGAVLAAARELPPERTLYIVATKSGGTVETFSLLRYFYQSSRQALGAERVGHHWATITDPGSTLHEIARERRFRHTFLNDPEIGGRYAALSLFGLVPAALIGMNVGEFLARAAAAVARERDDPWNPAVLGGALLGSVLGVLTRRGRDKLTLRLSPALRPFGPWLEQLLAECTGKEGRGILPVLEPAPLNADAYGDDRFFLNLSLAAEGANEVTRPAHISSACPRGTIHLADRYDLGGHIYLWEMAVAVAGHILEIHPFNQPDVESTKRRTREICAAYGEKGVLEELSPTGDGDGMAVYAGTPDLDPLTAWRVFLEQASPGAYVAIQAYLQPGGAIDAALAALQEKISARTCLAATVGYGPRYLHSTGQLHKGDGGRGLFIQLTARDPQDAPIPDELDGTRASITFGVLKAAQALGDWQALRQAGRRIIRFHFRGDVLQGLTRLTDAL